MSNSNSTSTVTVQMSADERAAFEAFKASREAIEAEQKAKREQEEQAEYIGFLRLFGLEIDANGQSVYPQPSVNKGNGEIGGIRLAYRGSFVHRTTVALLAALMEIIEGTDGLSAKDRAAVWLTDEIIKSAKQAGVFGDLSERTEKLIEQAAKQRAKALHGPVKDVTAHYKKRNVLNAPINSK